MRLAAYRWRSLFLATTLAANAQPFQGVYVGAGAGYNMQAVRATPLSPPSDPTAAPG